MVVILDKVIWKSVVAANMALKLVFAVVVIRAKLALVWLNLEMFSLMMVSFTDSRERVLAKTTSK